MRALVGAASSSHSGAVIVALPVAHDPVHGLATDAHVTMNFLGDATEVAPEDQDEIVELLRLLAANLGELEAEVAGVATLGDNNTPVLLVQSGPLTRIRELLATEPVVQRLTARVEQHASWIAHVSVDAGAARRAAATKRVTIGALGLWVGGEQFNFLLSGPTHHAGPQPDDEAAELAAAIAASGMSLLDISTPGQLRAAIPGADRDRRARTHVIKAAGRLGMLAELPQWPEIGEATVQLDRTPWRITPDRQLVDARTGEPRRVTRRERRAVTAAAPAQTAIWPTIESAADLFRALRTEPSDSGVRGYLIKHAARLDRLHWLPTDWPERTRVAVQRDGREYRVNPDNTLRPIGGRRIDRQPSGLVVTPQGAEALGALTRRAPAHQGTQAEYEARQRAVPQLAAPRQQDPAQRADGGLR